MFGSPLSYIYKRLDEKLRLIFGLFEASNLFVGECLADFFKMK